LPPIFIKIGKSEKFIETFILDLIFPPGDNIFESYIKEFADFPFAARFLEEGNMDILNMDNLMAQVRKWLSQELGDKIIFYSAQEEEEIPGMIFSPSIYRRNVFRTSRPNLPEGTIINGPGIPVIPEFKAVTTKKSTVASLAAKVDQIMDVLPTLIALLQAMADQQKNWN
jgi:hypothetical protein